MSLKHSSRFLFFVLVVLAAFTSGAHAYALTVDAVRVGAHPGKTRVVLDLSAPSKYQVSLMADPYRLVIDLPDADWKAGGLGQTAGTGIKQLRYGSVDGGLTRIVMELNKPYLVAAAFALPRGPGGPDRLVIDISPSTDAKFRQSAAKAQGPSTAALAAPKSTGGTPPPSPTPRSAESYLRAPEMPPQEQAEEDQPSAYKPKAGEKKPLVVIDAGHGGPDTGALGVNGVREKDVTLAIARELGRQLQKSGAYRVMLTRDSDFFIPLHERVEFARGRGADLFISIHADSISKRAVQGASIYTLSDKASDAESAKLAEQENKADLIGGIDLSNQDQDVADILVDLTMRDTMNQSRYFATKIANIFPAQGLRLLEKPTRSAGFAVLKAPDIPSVLVETGYLSSPRESRQLSDPAYRAKIATALKKGVDAYFEQVRRNQRI